MNENLRYLIEQEIERGAYAWASSRSDHVYDKRRGSTGFTTPIRCIYFNYIGLDDQKRFVIEHYFYPGGDQNADSSTWPRIPYPEDARVDSDLKTHITNLAINARGPKNNPPKYAENFKNLVWKRRGYFVLFFDEDCWKLIKNKSRSGVRRGAVLFYPTKGGKRLTPNHSFYDAKDFEITLPGEANTRSAVVFINYLKDESGADLDGEEPYEFGVFVGVELAAGKDPPLTLIVDPGGTNDGPPLEP
jgi:hypothetical protein